MYFHKKIMHINTAFKIVKWTVRKLKLRTFLLISKEIATIQK